VGLIKIDVEGLELRVLKGALEVLRQNQLPPLLFECWSGARYQKEKEALLEFVESLGYEIHRVRRYNDMILATAKKQA